MIKTSKFGTKYLHKQIEQDPALPFVTTVLGQEVTVARFESIKRDRIVAPSHFQPAMVFLDGFVKLMGRPAGRCLKGADGIRLRRPVSGELSGLARQRETGKELPDFPIGVDDPGRRPHQGFPVRCGPWPAVSGAGKSPQCNFCAVPAISMDRQSCAIGASFAELRLRRKRIAAVSQDPRGNGCRH